MSVVRRVDAKITSPRLRDYVQWTLPSGKNVLERLFSRPDVGGTFPKEFLRARNPRRLHVDPMISGPFEYWMYRGDIFESNQRGLSSAAFLEAVLLAGLVDKN